MKNEIKTKYIYGELNIAAAYDEIINADNSWIPQDNVRVIGFDFATEVTKQAAEYDSGFLVVHAEVSKIAQWHADGCILEQFSRMEGASVTVAAGVSEVMTGNHYDNKNVVFPFGYFIDLDEGEPLYVNVFRKNTMANTHGTWWGLIIYYVEK